MEQELHRSYHYHHQNQIHTQILLEIKNVCYSLNAFNLPGQKDIVLREKLPLHTHTLSLSLPHTAMSSMAARQISNKATYISLQLSDCSMYTYH